MIGFGRCGQGGGVKIVGGDELVLKADVYIVRVGLWIGDGNGGSWVVWRWQVSDGVVVVGIVVLSVSRAAKARRTKRRKREGESADHRTQTLSCPRLKLQLRFSLLFLLLLLTKIQDHQLKSSSLPPGSLQSTLLALATPMCRSRSTYHF